MRITVIGCGYGGVLCNGSACFAEMGNHVHLWSGPEQSAHRCLEQRASAPLRNPGMDAMLATNISGRRAGPFTRSLREALQGVVDRIYRGSTPLLETMVLRLTSRRCVGVARGARDVPPAAARWRAETIETRVPARVVVCEPA